MFCHDCTVQAVEPLWHGHEIGNGTLDTLLVRHRVKEAKKELWL
jgi:hypothetical protein